MTEVFFVPKKRMKMSFLFPKIVSLFIILMLVGLLKEKENVGIV